jgi:hypothetical protein
LHENGFSRIEAIPFDFLHPAIPKFALRFGMMLATYLEKIPLINELAGSLVIKCQK